MKSKRKFLSSTFDSLFKLKKAIRLINSLGHLEKRIANLEMHVPMLTNQTIERIQHLTRVLQPKHSNSKLIRIGNSGDGGYVICPPQSKSLILSLGVGNEISTDIQLIEDFDCTVYAFDPFVEKPEFNSELFKFYQIGCGKKRSNTKTLDFRSLKEILVILPRIPDLVFIDIEGDEWDLATDVSLLNQSQQIIMEFHNLDKVIDDIFYSSVLNMLKKLLESHTPIHIHGNNCGPTVPIGGAAWPSILEVTFLRNDLFGLAGLKNNYGPFPTTLDSPNSDLRPDLNLSPFFGDFSLFNRKVDRLNDVQ